eukprot:4620090-Pyramimonas_sp.AAC.1
MATSSRADPRGEDALQREDPWTGSQLPPGPAQRASLIRAAEEAATIPGTPGGTAAGVAPATPVAGEALGSMPTPVGGGFMHDDNSLEQRLSQLFTSQIESATARLQNESEAIVRNAQQALQGELQLVLGH